MAFCKRKFRKAWGKTFSGNARKLNSKWRHKREKCVLFEMVERLQNRPVWRKEKMAFSKVSLVNSICNDTVFEFKAMLNNSYKYGLLNYGLIFLYLLVFFRRSSSSYEVHYVCHGATLADFITRRICYYNLCNHRIRISEWQIPYCLSQVE